MTKIGQKRRTPKKPIRKRANIKLTPLDVLFSKLIRVKSDYTCEYCGNKPHKQGLHCSHFIGRRYRNTRWLEDNACCLCFACHNYMHDFPSVHKDFFVKRLGSDRVEQLEIIALSGNKPDLEEIGANLKNKLKELCLNNNETHQD